MTSIDFNLLFPTNTPSPASGAAARKRAPKPPWDVSVKEAPVNEQVRAALRTRTLIAVGKVKAGLPGAEEDYSELFALYNGLSTLDALTQRMDVKGVLDSERRQIERRFAEGMREVGAYVDKLKLDKLKLVRGEVVESARSLGGVRRDRPQHTTGVMHRGTADAAIAGLGGDDRFTVTVSTPTTTTSTPPPPKTIAVDLGAIGPADSRTLNAVVAHLNKRMTDAGVLTRFERVKIPQEPRTVKVGDKTVTLPAGPDQWAIKVAGVSSEILNFTAPSRADAVYLAQNAGKAAAEQPEAQRRELLKFQADAVVGAVSDPPQTLGEANWVAGRVFSKAMDPDIAAVRATAAGADGSVYVLAELTGEVAGQVIKGERDVALLKYDSTGQLLFSRTLGAADEAKASAIAVSADGKVAIAGSVKGVLRDANATTVPAPAGTEVPTGSTSLNAAEYDSFVTLFDAEGAELWTRRGGAVASDAARAIAFGADGKVYAAGQSTGSMPGQTSVGGQDAWVRGYEADGKLAFTRQFGTAGSDGAAALAVEGSSLVVAGVEGGAAVVRRFDLAAANGPALTATRSLGNLAGGSVAGVNLENGRVTLAGTTSSGSLSAGAVTSAFSGARDAFVVSLDASLNADLNDRVTYWGGGGEEEVTAVALRGGQAWITGSSTQDVAGLPRVGAKDGFVARIDATTGAVGWARRFTAKDGETAPSAIAVGAGGASVLDRLGLPSGTIDYTGAQPIAASTAARAGDRFFVKVNGGRMTAVTLEAQDTLKTLAAKVNRALGFNGKVEVVKTRVSTGEAQGEYDNLQIKPRSPRHTIELISGETGRDLLETLGLVEGTVRTVEKDRKGKEIVPDGGKTYGLKLARDLVLTSKAEIKRARDELNTARNTIRMAYRDLANALNPPAKPAAGPAPAHLQAQLANYQAGLARLGGG